MESEKSSATQSERASLEMLTRTPYIRVLTYPKISLRTAKFRVRQLGRLGVTEVVFRGQARIGRLGILGIGTVGVVVGAVAKGTLCALKIRRTDANRADMGDEVRLTTLANKLGIGPDVVAHTKDFILMKLLEGQELEAWLKGLKGRGKREEAKELVHSLLNQCRKLDIMGIDHGQLSNLRKHAVVAVGRPWLIDFESAGTFRRPRNVTSAAQYLFVGGRLSPLMRRTLGVRSKEPILQALASYKREMSDYYYAKLLETLKLASD